MFSHTDKILKACQHIQTVVRDKSKEEVNPLLIRIHYVTEELQTHLLAVASANSVQQQKYHWSVLYRDGDALDEMMIMLNNTTPVFIQSEVEYIKQGLVFFTQHLVQTYGKRESLFIITPKFQELSELW
ncbi:hypothetical protein J7E71_12570 [Mesobacillus foraminis]|uniref:hypothetical protein n=1 Tax=Mesobacillus foraminis TaxID=279826 RepID=UPI001BE4F831|nr:hypothetical protein [Mesobacillus foraminis]MBT2756789.1 hypothetical protein [Mesobacillus foraminis]